MVWIFFVLVALVVVVAFAAVLAGRITPDPMAEPVSTAPDPGLPPGEVRAADVDEVRFDTALRGYRMDQVDDVLDRLRARLAELEAAADAGAHADAGAVPTAGRNDDGSRHD